MLTPDIIRLVRRKITDVDPSASDYPETDLLVFMNDALMTLKACKVLDFDTLSIVLDDQSPQYGVLPEATDTQALVLAFRTAVDILHDEYAGKLRRGELGMSWKSGLEEESSTIAASLYASLIEDMEDDLNAIILIQNAKKSVLRAQ